MTMTMSGENNPWKGIDKPLSGFNVLRIDPAHPHDFFWGRDAQGNYLILLEIEDKSTSHLQDKLIELRGIRTDIRFNQNTDRYVYVLSLQENKNVDIFLRLCNDLVACTKGVKGNRDALDILHSRLKSWKAFLSKKKRYLLITQEVQGLFAELSFIEKCIDNNCIDPVSLMTGWKGPMNGPHDFVFGDFAIEIKSISGSQKNMVRISSENQLITHLDRLYLQVYFLAEYHDKSYGISLNSIVERVREKISEEDISDIFDSRLNETGYIELPDNDSPCFSVIQEKTFEVKEGFPRITPDALSEGLANVSYDLNLGSVENYVCKFPLSRSQ